MYQCFVHWKYIDCIVNLFTQDGGSNSGFFYIDYTVHLVPFPRNPSHNDRPSASDISGEFCKSERILLSWKKEDIVSPSAQVLGGPLSKGEKLYKDLQSIYNDPYYY